MNRWLLGLFIFLLIIVSVELAVYVNLKQVHQPATRISFQTAPDMKIVYDHSTLDAYLKQIKFWQGLSWVGKEKAITPPVIPSALVIELPSATDEPWFKVAVHNKIYSSYGFSIGATGQNTIKLYLSPSAVSDLQAKGYQSPIGTMVLTGLCLETSSVAQATLPEQERFNLCGRNSYNFLKTRSQNFMKLVKNTTSSLFPLIKPVYADYCSGSGTKYCGDPTYDCQCSDGSGSCTNGWPCGSGGTCNCNIFKACVYGGGSSCSSIGHSGCGVNSCAHPECYIPGGCSWVTTNPTATPVPAPTATPVPPPSGGSCDSSCGTCGYRNSSGSCGSDNGCCHRTCSGSNCVTVFGSGSNACNNNSQCSGGPTNTPPVSGCSGIVYTLSPISPENPSTTVTVNINRSTATSSYGWNNVGLLLDGTSQGIGLCFADGTNCSQGYHSFINSGLAGTHTLIFTINFGANQCNNTTFQTAVVMPTPTAYPTAVITGRLEQNSGNTCYQAGGANTFSSPTINVTPNPSACITPACNPNASNATGYTCTVKIDNQGCVAAGQPVPPNNTTLTLSTITTSYGTGTWAAPANGVACQLTGSQLAVTAGNTYTTDIAFPLTQPNWIKLKNASFNGTSTTNVIIPNIVNKYDGTSDDDGSKYFIIGEAGTTTGVTVNPPSAYSASPRNWHMDTAQIISMSPTQFVAYIKSRKSYQPISALSQINADGIYLWTGGNTSINGTEFGIHNVVFVADGSSTVINIKKDHFSPTGSVAIIANEIDFDNTTLDAKGIFIANTINTGITSNQGLKITGNLIAQTTLTNNRQWTDTSKPSIFIIFNQQPYLDLLPYLSIAKYNWQQSQ